MFYFVSLCLHFALCVSFFGDLCFLYTANTTCLLLYLLAICFFFILYSRKRVCVQCIGKKQLCKFLLFVFIFCFLCFVLFCLTCGFCTPRSVGIFAYLLFLLLLYHFANILKTSFWTCFFSYFSHFLSFQISIWNVLLIMQSFLNVCLNVAEYICLKDVSYELI